MRLQTISLREGLGYYLLRPQHAPTRKQRLCAWITTLALGVFLGLAHVILAIRFSKQRLVVQKKEERRLRTLLWNNGEDFEPLQQVLQEHSQEIQRAAEARQMRGQRADDKRLERKYLFLLDSLFWNSEEIVKKTIQKENLLQIRLKLEKAHVFFASQTDRVAQFLATRMKDCLDALEEGKIIKLLWRLIGNFLQHTHLISERAKDFMHLFYFGLDDQYFLQCDPVTKRSTWPEYQNYAENGYGPAIALGLVSLEVSTKTKEADLYEKELIRYGDAALLYETSRMLLGQLGTFYPQEDSRAIRLLKRSAQDYLPAMVFLGSYYESEAQRLTPSSHEEESSDEYPFELDIVFEASPVEVDLSASIDYTRKALSWYFKAASLGSFKAYRILVDRYKKRSVSEEPLMPKNQVDVCLICDVIIADCALENGWEEEASQVTLLPAWGMLQRIALEKENIVAVYLLIKHLLRFEKDGIEEEIKIYLEILLRKGDPTSWSHLAALLSSEEKFDLLRAFLEEAAKQGDRVAAYQLAYAYMMDSFECSDAISLKRKAVRLLLRADNSDLTDSFHSELTALWNENPQLIELIPQEEYPLWRLIEEVGGLSELSALARQKMHDLLCNGADPHA